ncbi:MAG TPA: hypothetical protein PLB91_05675 [Spirochaetales bacterium]|nr:hypothetical protein [Spirochaetales bacterium]HRY56050.1 hypothetical protein [Spirochaetia bacterium]HRZ64774.1 hypothetical protein [Spirochaetia bacterium]
MSIMIQLLALVALDIAGLVLLWFLLRARLRRYLELENLLSGVREEARALVMELNETADRDVSLLEDRMGALRELLGEVDRRMGVARRELESRESERAAFERLRRRRPILPAQDEEELPIPLELRSSELRSSELRSSELRPSEPRSSAAGPSEAPPIEAPASLPDEPPPAGREGLLLGAVAEGRGEIPRRPEFVRAAEQVKPARSLREEAFDLYRKGFSADIIAARLGATVAEIELLVDIEERRSETGLGG